MALSTSFIYQFSIAQSKHLILCFQWAPPAYPSPIPRTHQNGSCHADLHQRHMRVSHLCQPF